LSGFHWPKRIEPIGVSPSAAPLISFEFNENWLPIVTGAIEQLLAWYTWQGDQATQDLAESHVNELLVRLAESPTVIYPPCAFLFPYAAQYVSPGSAGTPAYNDAMMLSQYHGIVGIENETIIRWVVPLAAGTKVLNFWGQTHTNQGMYMPFLNGEQVGTTPFDWYSNPYVNNVRQWRTIDTDYDGWHTIELRQWGKNASSSGFRHYLQFGAVHVQ
jgi:hypothetical protein